MQKKFATIYNVTEERNASFGTKNTEPTMTQISDQADTDINIIMKRYAKTGQIPQLIEQGKYGDFSQVGDFRAATEAILEANTLFAQVPANIRKRFDNDPAQFLEFVNDPENMDELRKMGLAKPKPRTDEVLPEEQERAARMNAPRYDDDHGTPPGNDNRNDNGRQERSAPGGAAGSPSGRPGGQQPGGAGGAPRSR